MLLEYGSEEVYPLSPRFAEELGAGMEMLHSYLTDSLYTLMAGKDIRKPGSTTSCPTLLVCGAMKDSAGTS